jgi:transposase
MPWRDLPERCGPYTTAYNRFSRWSRRGVWKQVFDQVAARSRMGSHFIDSAIVKAHRCAGGGKGERKSRRLASARRQDHEIDAVVDNKCRPLNFTITGGQAHDSQVVEEVLNTPRVPLAVSVDKAYDNKNARQQINDEGALPIIPSRSNAGKKAYCPRRFYRQRYKIENFFCRAKDWRRIATRNDKLARNFLAAVPMIGTLYWIKL